MTDEPIPGRSLVTRRAVRDLVRSAVLSAYGVAGFAVGGRLARLLDRAGLRSAGCRVTLGPSLDVELDLLVAHGLPIAEVARQVESAVRYTLRHAIGREPDRVAIRIGRLLHERGITPARDTPPGAGEPGPADLAASGTDVA